MLGTAGAALAAAEDEAAVADETALGVAPEQAVAHVAASIKPEAQQMVLGMAVMSNTPAQEHRHRSRRVL
ncbi:MAG: hypothetical protein WCP95_15525 [Actinomycetes bacterium]